MSQILTAKNYQQILGIGEKLARKMLKHDCEANKLYKIPKITFSKLYGIDINTINTKIKTRSLSPKNG